MTKISKIMITNVPTLKKDATVSEATKIITKGNHGCIVVVEGKKPLGVITESDIVKTLVSKQTKQKVTKIMSSPITSISSNTTLEKANKVIDTKPFRRYLVVDNNKLVGLVTQHKIVQAASDQIRFHRNIQNIVLMIFVVFELFIFILYSRIVTIFG
jgi:CBS domain-containing protein